MQDWKVVLRLSRTSALLLIASEGNDLLKARFDTPPNHPRALLTLLEGLSLWCVFRTDLNARSERT